MATTTECRLSLISTNVIMNVCSAYLASQPSMMTIAKALMHK